MYRHDQNMIVSGTVRPKVNHNFLSRSSNYAPFKLCKIKTNVYLIPLILKLISFLSHDIENLQKHFELSLIEMCAASRRFAPIGRLNKCFFEE
jgi:hypothetical protein